MITLDMFFNNSTLMDTIETNYIEEVFDIVGVTDYYDVNEDIRADWLKDHPAHPIPYVEWTCNINELRDAMVKWFKEEKSFAVRQCVFHKLFECKLGEDDKWDLFNNCCLSQMKVMPSANGKYKLIWYGEDKNGEVIAIKDSSDFLDEEYDFIGEYYKKMTEEKIMITHYTLGNYEEFMKDVANEDIFPVLDKDGEPSPIEVRVNNKVCHIDMCADYWNELEYFFKECSEVEGGCKASTRGNTKVDLEEARTMCRDRLEDILEGWLEDTLNELEPYDKFRAYRNFWNLCHTESKLSDTAEVFRIEHDLRPSEVSPFYDEEWVHKVAEEIIEKSLEDCFEVDFDPHNDRSHLMYFGNGNTGEHVAWYYGKVSLGEAEWNQDKERVIAATWEAIKK